jgi:hypothetical protein
VAARAGSLEFGAISQFTWADWCAKGFVRLSVMLFWSMRSSRPNWLPLLCLRLSTRSIMSAGVIVDGGPARSLESGAISQPTWADCRAVLGGLSVCPWCRSVCLASCLSRLSLPCQRFC